MRSKILKTLALSSAFLLLPMPALAVQYDGIKNLSSSTRTYNLVNPTQTIAISPGQSVIIQDTQFTSSTALESDVANGYLNEYVIGSPNSTQTSYTQPVSITSSSNAAAGLLISESAGSQPGISVTQTNSGDLMDLYQANAPELILNSNLFHIYPQATFENNLTIGNSGANAGQITFGNANATTLSFTSSGGAPGTTNFPASVFGFSNGPISTNNSGGYYIGTYQLLNTDNSGNYTTLHSQNGTFNFNNIGTTYATLTPTCFTLGGSCFGQNTIIAGNLTVNGLTTFANTAANNTISGVIIGNLDLNLQPGDATHSVNIRSSTGTNLQQFNNDGSFSLASSNITSDLNGNFRAPSITSPTFAIPGAGSFTNVGNITYLSSASNGGFEIRNSAGTNDLLKLNDNGTGTLLGNINFTNAGALNVASLNASSNSTISGQLAVTGQLNGADIFASRGTNSGFVFFGTSGTHSLGFDGNQYIFGNGAVTLQGYLTANSGISSGNLSILPTGVANSGTNYSSSSLTFLNSIWSSSSTGSSAVQNAATLYENQSNQLVSSVTFNTPVLNASASVASPNLLTQFLTGSPNSLSLQTSNGNAYPINIAGNAVNFSTGQPINITGNLAVNGSTQFNGSMTAYSTFNGNGVVSTLSVLYAGPNPSSATSGTSPGDVIADRGNNTAQYWFGNNRSNYMLYNGSQYFLSGGQLFIQTNGLTLLNNGNFTTGGSVQAGSANITNTLTANIVAATNGLQVYGQNIGKIYHQQIRPSLSGGYWQGTLSLGPLAGNANVVYDLYAKWFGDDWAANGGTPIATMAGSGASWEASSISELDEGQQTEQTIDYIGTATGGQTPLVQLTLNHFAPLIETGAFTFTAIPR